MGHQGGGNRSVQVGFATRLFIESIKDSERLSIQTHGKPNHGGRFGDRQRLRAGKERSEFFLLARLGRQFDEQCEFSHGGFKGVRTGGIGGNHAYV